MPPKAILEAVLLTLGGMSNLLERMEQKQLIERIPDPNDRRGVLVKLTSKGKTIIDEAMTEHVKIEEKLISLLNKSERAALVVLLRKLLITLDQT